MPDTAVPRNGASTFDDLFALSDEQILDIDGEPQDIEIANLHLDEPDRAVFASVPEDGERVAAEARDSRASADSIGTPACAAAIHGTLS